MDAVAAFYTFQKVFLSGVVGGGVHKVEAGFIYRHGVGRDENTYILHARVLGVGAAIAIHRHIFHYIDIHGVALEIFDYREGGVRHGFEEQVMVCRPNLVGFSRAVDVRLAVGRGYSYRELFKSAAVTAHGMSLEVGKHEKRIVICQVLTHIVFLYDFSAGNIQHEVGTLGVHKVYGEIFVPAVLFESSQMFFGSVAFAFVCGITFDDGTADAVGDGLPEVGTQKVLVADFARVDFHRYFSLQFYVLFIIQSDNFFGRDFPREKDFGFQNYILLYLSYFLFIIY